MIGDKFKMSEVLELKRKEHTDDCLIYQPTSSKFECMCDASAHNAVIDDLDQREIDIEALAKLIAKKFPSVCIPYNERKIAKHLADNMNLWIKRER